MSFGVTSWNLLLHILLVMLANNGSESRKMSQENWEGIGSSLQLPSVIKDDVDQNDQSSMIFFTVKDLKVGEKLPIYFPRKDPSSSPHLLPRDEAASIPFSLKELPQLLNLFSFSQDSPQAKAMQYTLRTCELEPIKGETKFCATSLDSMLDFTSGVFDLERDFSVVTTTFLTNSSTSFQNYTILEVPKEILSSKMVACHTMPYPYVIFYCHYEESENKVFKILLGGENGDKVEAVAVCHMDTSHWSRDHVSFHLLRIEPGTLPVCHFFPADHLLWFQPPSLIQ
ncbi:BURP domain containing protein [Parasponia andersonii]|uniref:BURP domain containing protein n=1 Tax=Parasponia andersonii TaxID=3476 RepID=A0A2P5DU83_PARAD|nr:BURP domain containing protein [Parasponia andersonii]